MTLSERISLSNKIIVRVSIGWEKEVLENASFKYVVRLSEVFEIRLEKNNTYEVLEEGFENVYFIVSCIHYCLYCMVF